MPERPPPPPMPPPPRCGDCGHADDSRACRANHRREMLVTALVLGVPVLAVSTISVLQILGIL